MAADRDHSETNPTIFLRLNAEEETRREFAWGEFSERYAPIISAFAGRFGARAQDVDDVIQDVLLGFFLKSPTFTYDPAKGRFRGYLKVCTFRALAKRIGRDARLQGIPLDRIDPDAASIEQVWSDVWEQDQLRRALDELRKTMGSTKTFQAFEQHVIFDEAPNVVAEKLGMHLNSVYRAREQITEMLREKLQILARED